MSHEIVKKRVLVIDFRVGRFLLPLNLQGVWLAGRDLM